MTAGDTRLQPRAAGISEAMHAVVAAGTGLAAAKRTRSEAVIECAQQDLQRAVDAARELDVEWGPIGAALGIARGNAYQRFRKRSSHTAEQADTTVRLRPPL